MAKQVTKADNLADINKEIRRLARLINDRVYRAEMAIDETGLIYQAIANVSAVAERTTKKYNPRKPRLSAAKLPTKTAALKRLEQYQKLVDTTKTLTSKGQAEWYNRRIKEVNERTGLSFDKKHYQMLIRLQHTMGNNVWASSQLVEFFGTLAAIPKSTRDKLPIDLTNYDSIIDFLQGTSFPMDELRTMFDEASTRKNFDSAVYVATIRNNYNKRGKQNE